MTFTLYYKFTGFDFIFPAFNLYAIVQGYPACLIKVIIHNIQRSIRRVGYAYSIFFSIKMPPPKVIARAKRNVNVALFSFITLKLNLFPVFENTRNIDGNQNINVFID